MTGDEFQIRPARAADREAVLAFCAQTWEWGDYIAEVWDRWLADTVGILVVGEIGGQVMGVDKLTFLAPGEAFFEGLRIAPAYRGRGYAGRFQRFMLAEAAHRGAHVLRFLTAANNTPIHKNAARDAFVRGPALLTWEAPPGPTAIVTPVAIPLQPGPVADAAWAALPASPMWAATSGLVSHAWHVQAWTRALWDALLAAGNLFTLPAPDGSTAPGVIALIPEQHYAEAVWLAYLDGALDAARLAELAGAARQVAAARGYTELHAMLPGVPAIAAGLRTAGWTAGATEGTLFVFEKTLPAE